VSEVKNKYIIGDNLSFLKQNRSLAPKRQADSRKEDFLEIYQNKKDGDLVIQADRCLDCGNPYCEWKCPIHNYIPDWLELVANKQFDKAAALMHQTNPLPEICGRVCPHDRLCEQACTLNTGLGAVTIGEIEKTITDKALNNNWRPDLSRVKSTGKKVAIVGAGPAGIACAEFLARNGVKAVIYDKYPEIGGLLTFGIPGFKLEKEILTRRRKFLEDIGVEFVLNTEVGKDISIDELKHEFHKIFLGMGTYKAVDGNLPGSDSNGVIAALDYLIGNINQQQNYQMPDVNFQDLSQKDVVVLGGGDTAMDCVRSAVRQNANSVTCVYRKQESDMPGSKTEVKNAMEEGVRFIFNLQPVEIIANQYNEVGSVVFERTDFDQLKYKDKQVILDTNIVVIAFGFRASPNDWFVKADIKTHDSGLILTNEDSLRTSTKNVFAGGDMVSGADLVVTAIAQGREAAKQIIGDFQKESIE
jgi:glutamate synthase (NADPH/NADH) small chain